MDPVHKSCCNTQATRDQTCFTWNISDFSLYASTAGELLSSSTFSGGTNDKLKWTLDLYPKGNTEACKEYVSIFLILSFGFTTDIRVKFEISIINVANKKLKSLKTIIGFNKSNLAYGWNQFVKRDLLLPEVKLCKDVLTIVCEVGIVSDSTCVQLKQPKSNLIRDFRNLFEKQEFTDVTIVADGHEFQAHKAILSARSVVFSAMFQHKMEENQLNRVVITDVDHEVFNKMLHFIYTDEAENLENIAADLLAAADKYDLEKLKIICGETLQKNISIETAANTLILADRHNADQLKAYTSDFIYRNFIAVMDTEGWKDMIKKQDELFNKK